MRASTATIEIPRDRRTSMKRRGNRWTSKHIRKNQDQPQGEIAEREGTIHWSNVMREDRYMRNRTAKEALTTQEAGDKAEAEE